MPSRTIVLPAGFALSVALLSTGRAEPAAPPTPRPPARVYTNEDVIGSELGGALKNVIALASGMADGLGAGDKTRAAVITRLPRVVGR